MFAKVTAGRLRGALSMLIVLFAIFVIAAPILIEYAESGDLSFLFDGVRIFKGLIFLILLFYITKRQGLVFEEMILPTNKNKWYFIWWGTITAVFLFIFWNIVGLYVLLGQGLALPTSICFIFLRMNKEGKIYLLNDLTDQKKHESQTE